MHEYMVRCKVLDEGIVTFVVSALIETLKGGSDTNVIVCEFFTSLCQLLKSYDCSSEVTSYYQHSPKNVASQPMLPKQSLEQW